MRWSLLVLVVAMAGLPAPDPVRDQEEVSFEPRKIASSPSGPVTLTEAIDLITKDTGNKVEIIGAELHPEIMSKKHAVQFGGKLFWDALVELCATWDMSPNLSYPGKMCLNFEADLKKANAGPGPLGIPSQLAPPSTQGVYRIGISSGPNELLVWIFAEPRLDSFQFDQAELVVRGKNGKTAKLPLKGKATSACFSFDASKAPDPIAEVALQCQLAYVHDRRIDKLGNLATILKNNEKTLEAGLYSFRVTSAKFVTKEDGRAGLQVAYLFGPDIEARLDEFYLVRTGKRKAFAGEPDYEKEDGPMREAFYGPLTGKIPSDAFELWVRAPRTITKQKIQHVLKL